MLIHKLLKIDNNTSLNILSKLFQVDLCISNLNSIYMLSCYALSKTMQIHTSSLNGINFDGIRYNKGFL